MSKPRHEPGLVLAGGPSVSEDPSFGETLSSQRMQGGSLLPQIHFQGTTIESRPSTVAIRGSLEDLAEQGKRDRIVGLGFYSGSCEVRLVTELQPPLNEESVACLRELQPLCYREPSFQKLLDGSWFLFQ